MSGGPIDIYQSGPATSGQFLRRWQLSLLGPGGATWEVSNSNATGAVDGGTITIDDALKIAFKTRQTSLDSRGSLDVTIFNLRRTPSILELRNLYNRVILQAGYRTGRWGTIFDGQIIDWKQGRDDNLVDTFTKVLAQDGDAPYNVATAQMAIKKGTTYLDAVKATVAPMIAAGAKLGQINLLAPTDKLIRGIVHSGMAVDALRNMGLNSHIANGVLNVAPIGASFQVGAPVTVNSDTGLVGMASLIGNNGIEFIALLNPTLQVHGTVIINQADINIASGQSGNGIAPGVSQVQGPSRNVSQFAWYVDPAADGRYEALVIEHSGDSRGNEWYTHVRAWPIGVQPTPSAFQFYKGYGVGPTGGQTSVYNETPSLPADTGGF